MHRSDSSGRSAGARRVTRALIATAALATSVVLAACSSSTTAASTTPARDDLVVVVASIPRTTTGEPSVGQAASTQAGLISQKANPGDGGNYALDPYSFDPVLASSYDVSADGLTYTFHLAKGVKSAAGNPFTADDVIWSFQRHFEVKGSNSPAIFAPVLTDPDTQIAKVDDSTVTFTIPQPGEGLMLLSNLAQNGLVYDSAELKKHATADDPYAVAWSLDNQNFGFGAYTVTTYTPDQEIVLAANPAYVLGKPAIQKVTFRVVADPGARANALVTKDADVAETLNATDLTGLQSSGAAQNYTSTYRNSILTMSLLTTAAPLDNPKVREALSYAMPYQGILDNVYAGQGTITPGRLDPTEPGYIGDGIPEKVTDAAKSKALLAEAGFPDGVTIDLTVNSAISDTVAAAVQIQSAAKAGGFTININQLASAAFLEQRRAATLQSLLEVIPATNASPAYQMRIFFEDNTLNRTKWVNQPYLDLVADALTKNTDAEQGVLFNQAEQVLMQNTPSIWIVRPAPTVGYATGLSGILSTSASSYALEKLHW